MFDLEKFLSEMLAISLFFILLYLWQVRKITKSVSIELTPLDERRADLIYRLYQELTAFLKLTNTTLHEISSHPLLSTDELTHLKTFLEKVEDHKRLRTDELINLAENIPLFFSQGLKEDLVDYFQSLSEANSIEHNF